MNKVCYLVTSLMVMAAACIQAATVITNTNTLEVVADTFVVNLEFTNTNYDGDGQLIVGSSAYSSGKQHRALIRFDASGLPVPANTPITVSSATLRVKNASSGGQGSPTINVYDYAYEFDETKATWNDPDGDGSPLTGDTQSGGTYSTLVASKAVSVTAGALNAFTSNTAFLDVVASAIVGDDTINLLLKRNSETDNNVYVRFTDLEGDTSGFFTLDVIYSYAAPPVGTIVIVK